MEKFRQLPFRDLRLLCTSRLNPRIQSIFENEATIEVSARGEDIVAFVKSRIEKWPKLKRQVERDSSLSGFIGSKVVERADGM